MSHTNEETVVKRNGPFFLPCPPLTSPSKPPNTPQHTLLLLIWLSNPHLNVWYQNFLAREYSTLTHVAYAISLARPNTRSSTHLLRKVNTYPYAVERLPNHRQAGLAGSVDSENEVQE